MRRVLLLVCALVLLLGAAGCARYPGGIAASNIPIDPGHYVPLGDVEASDCNVNLLGLLPVSGGNHTADAVKNAMGERPGTDALVNITVDRVFKFFILWSETCTEVRATAVALH